MARVRSAGSRRREAALEDGHEEGAELRVGDLSLGARVEGVSPRVSASFCSPLSDDGADEVLNFGGGEFLAVALFEDDVDGMDYVFRHGRYLGSRDSGRKVCGGEAFCFEGIRFVCVDGHRKLLSVAFYAFDSKSDDQQLQAMKFGEIQTVRVVSAGCIVETVGWWFMAPMKQAKKRLKTDAAQAAAADVLELFHPVTAQWFRAVFEGVTAPQREGWPAIARGESTLILAPTGTGKTLTAFLWCLDKLMLREPA